MSIRVQLNNVVDSLIIVIVDVLVKIVLYVDAGTVVICTKP